MSAQSQLVCSSFFGTNKIYFMVSQVRIRLDDPIQMPIFLALFELFIVAELWNIPFQYHTNISLNIYRGIIKYAYKIITFRCIIFHQKYFAIRQRYLDTFISKSFRNDAGSLLICIKGLCEFPDMPESRCNNIRINDARI